MHITKWKKPIWKDYILYDSNYMTFWERQNYRHSKNISHCQSVWGGVRMNRQSTEDFNCGENTLYGTIMVGTCYYTFVQTHRLYNTKSEPWCKLWTLGGCDMSASVGSSVVPNVPFWWGMFIIGEPVIVWGQREDEKSLYLLLNFSVNLKLLKIFF